MVIKSSLLENVPIFRTGGDEFVAFLSRATQQDANETVEAMQKRCEMFKLPEHSISISFGTSIIEDADSAAYDAIALADRAMYDDKAARKRARS